MKKTLSILFFLVLFICAYPEDTLRIMTFNIDYGQDTTLKALGEFIKQYDPDIVALQEVDVMTRRKNSPKTHNRNLITELAFYTQMLPVFGKAINHPTGGFYGDAILTKYDIKSVETYTLPRSDKKIEERQMVVATLNAKGHDIAFASTHLSFENPQNRKMQLKRLNSIMRQYKYRKKLRFICGDLNSDTSEKLVLPILKGFQDAFDPDDGTFSANTQSETYKQFKYDYILFSSPKNDTKVINYIIDCIRSYSDHCICIADIVIK
ncbi:MAG: endonuclease/exonuclease/phosphatase family protein [Paludibacteraceae bacterium]|nr:endonuclease/exonuclease/phosphatase family protein [Paludibacteraceae bacterium]